MKASASIIAFAAMLASQGTVQAGRGFRDKEGVVAKCRVRDSDGVDGGIFMFQETGSDITFVGTRWRDLDYLDFFDDEDYTGFMDVDIYDTVADGNCMNATQEEIAHELGQIETRQCGKGRFVDEAFTGLSLDTVIGKHVGLSYQGDMIQCCTLFNPRDPDNNNN